MVDHGVIRSDYSKNVSFLRLLSAGKSKRNFDTTESLSVFLSFTEKMESVLQTADYAVFIALLLVSLGVGLLFAYRGRNQSPDDYLLNNKNMNPYA